MSTKAVKEALVLLRKYIEDSGPCDHAVNVCVCGEARVLEEATDVLAAIERAARDLVEVSSYPFSPNSPRGKKYYPAMTVLRAIAQQKEGQ